MPALLEIAGLRIQYVESHLHVVHAVNGVNLEVHSGEVLGLLGESGCGKSTLAKTLLGLLPKSALVATGAVIFEREDLLSLAEEQLNGIRGARLSMIPQEPGPALNPMMRVGDQVVEVLRSHRSWSWKDCRNESKRLLARVGLGEDKKTYDAYPHQLSGGQQQRVAIAQALACEPSLLIADEPTASLDAQSREEILQLFRDLKAKIGLSMLLITHEPSILRGLADRVAVMYAGRIVEVSTASEIFHRPQHPYTRALFACASPPMVKGSEGIRRVKFAEIPGAAPDAGSPQIGCAFAPRCTHRFHECDLHVPMARPTDGASLVECFLYGS